MKQKEYVYKIELTENQAKMLSYACDQFSRLICGQNWSYQELMEAAWEKRCKEATGKMMSKDFEGGWNKMRQTAETLCREIKRVFWGLPANTMNGIHYDDTADILFDIYQVIRHQLWLDRPDDKKSRMTVDSDPAMQHGKEPLAKITNILTQN